MRSKYIGYCFVVLLLARCNWDTNYEGLEGYPHSDVKMQADFNVMPTREEEALSNADEKESSVFLVSSTIGGYSIDEYATAQIWQYKAYQDNLELLYEEAEAIGSFNGLLEDTIPSSELAIFLELYGDYPQDEVVLESFFELSKISISPNENLIAWVEGVGWYPNTSSYGYFQVVVADVNNQEKTVIAQYDFHLPQDAEENALFPVSTSEVNISQPIWSADGRYLITRTDVVRSFEGRTGINSIDVYDLQTRQLTSYKPNSERYHNMLRWANNINQLAYTSQPRSDLPQADVNYVDTLEIIDFQDMTSISQLQTIKSDHRLGSPLDWSPDDSKIATIGYLEEATLSKTVLLLIDIATSKSREIPLDDNLMEVVWELRWSPNGNYIGVKYQSSSRADNLAIIEVETGNIVTTEFQSVDKFGGWQWIGEEEIVMTISENFEKLTQVIVWQWLTGERDFFVELSNQDVFLEQEELGYFDIVN